MGLIICLHMTKVTVSHQ